MLYNKLPQVQYNGGLMTIEVLDIIGMHLVEAADNWFQVDWAKVEFTYSWPTVEWVVQKQDYLQGTPSSDHP